MVPAVFVNRHLRNKGSAIRTRRTAGRCSWMMLEVQFEGSVLQVGVQEEEGGRRDKEHSFSAAALVPSAAGRCRLTSALHSDTQHASAC